ncbi:von Willebrand factor A domain-containing protein 7-like [Paramacrobiotus metropolitanus]|uniref:von Willebrand factor A domain-containing protein 7-like n=1 Tax=Paramacrobiotus metropolitanus TaxID=2943436 RepID=UPI0024462450|nr:von Willebrand factor A domain-containing protein 7-like [Paramacrobiotus metropolitanus]
MADIKSLFIAGFLLWATIGRNLAKECTEANGRDLVIAIDTTGSMHNTLEAVKAKCAELVEIACVTPSSPRRYILTPFDDPDWGPAIPYTDPRQFLQALDALTPEGGGDDPERCLEAVDAASDEAGEGAVIHVFTDNPTKKPSNISASALRAKLNKRQQAVRFTIPNPSIRESDVPDYVLLTVGDGALYITEPDMASIQTALFEIDNQDTVILQGPEKSDTASKIITVAVDAGMRMIELVLTDDRHLPSANFNPPTRSRTDPPVAQVVATTVNTKVYRVLNPVPGEWTISVQGTAPGWEAKINGQSTLDFIYAMGQMTSSGFLTHHGSSSSGDIATIQLTPSCDRCVVNSVSLIGSDGVVFGRPLVSFHPATKAYYANFTVPSELFLVQIRGRDKEGNVFERVHRTAVLPSSLRLEATRGGESPEPVAPGDSRRISYTIVNHGNSATFERTISGNAHVAAVSPSSVHVSTGERVTGYVEVIVPRTAVPGSTIEILLLISAPATGATSSLRKVITVADSGPTCKVTFSNLAEVCWNVGRDPVACRDQRYRVQVTFADQEMGLRTIRLVRDHWVGLATWSLPNDVAHISSETVSGIATGNCCTKGMKFVATNAKGETTECSVRR